MIDINLLPWREAKYKQENKTIILIYSLFLISVVFFLFCLHVFFSHQFIRVKSRVNFLEENLLRHATEVRQDKHVYAENEILLKKKLQDQIIIFQILNHLFHVNTPGIYIKDVAQQDGKMVIFGRASSMGAIYRYMSDILTVKKIHAVKLELAKWEGNMLQFQVRVIEFG